ncbi:MAG: FAD:protein FMN transferase, partial [Clostridia bacterium]
MGISSLKLRPGPGRAYLSQRGQSIDLGGIATGCAAGIATEVFKRLGTHSGLVDIGGNIAAYGPPEGGGPW